MLPGASLAVPREHTKQELLLVMFGRKTRTSQHVLSKRERDEFTPFQPTSGGGSRDGRNCSLGPRNLR